jgi:hypothetical protein
MTGPPAMTGPLAIGNNTLNSYLTVPGHCRWAGLLTMLGLFAMPRLIAVTVHHSGWAAHTSLNL